MIKGVCACCLLTIVGLAVGCGEAQEGAPVAAAAESAEAAPAIETPARPAVAEGLADVYEMFNLYMAPLNSSQVSQLQGGSVVVPLHRVAFRFRASATVIDALISQGYSPETTAIPTGGMSGMQGAGVLPLVVPEAAGRFSPAWNPAAVTNPERYQRQGSHGQGHLFESQLLVDRANGLVYYTGVGR